MDLGLKEKSALVTGGASNIGRAISITLAKEGANVAIADIDQEQAEKVIRTIEGFGGKAIAIKTDLTKYDQVEELVDKVLDQFKRLDILVNNLGWDEESYFVETTPEFWNKVININYIAFLNCCKVVLPHMIQRNAGVVISIGSDAARMGEFREGVYAGCKAAQIALSKTLAREVGRYGIRVNVICPGFTPASHDEVGKYSMQAKSSFTPELLDKVKKAYPLRHLGKPQDTASAVAFLASDAAGFITGQTLSVSGGYSMV